MTRPLDVIIDCMTSEPPKTVRMTYEAMKPKPDEPAVREVEPVELKGDTFFAWCRSRSALRQFKIARITSAAAGSAFVPRQPIVKPQAT